MGEIIIRLLKNEILRDVGTLARCVQSISDIKFRELNLQRGQFIFLTRICECPGINFIELSNMLKVDKATTTKAVQKLMAEEYVVRKRDLEDKRMWHLFPVARAEKVYDYIIQEENRRIASCLSDFSDEEKTMAEHLIKRMGQNIEQDWKTTKSLKDEEK
ncbi:MAG: transcriptional regulator, MarR family [Firmicutes bacterium]|nr:transcriptional regulator, MarR family [Bacillota bacterium]